MAEMGNAEAIQKIADTVGAIINKLGVSLKSFGTLHADTDWAFIIKLNSLLEASINHLLVRYFQDDRLEDAFAAMEMGDHRKGKMVFLKSLKLIPPSSQSFIKQLGSIRNRLAHKVTDMDFDLSRYIGEMSPDYRNALVGAMQEEMPESDMQSLLNEAPRKAFFGVTCLILFQIEDLINLQKSTLKDSGLGGGGCSVPPESNPKEL